MRAYFDGSFVPFNLKTNKRKQDGADAIVAWGLVFDDGETITEIHGSRKFKGRLVAGTHEIQAFIECALYCISHNIAPEDVSFTTDDELTVYGSQATVENGYACTSHSVVLEEMLVRLVELSAYNQATIDSVRPYLKRSLFTKVKGHSTTFWNLRCDYLAQVGAKVAEHGSAQLESVARWAKHGFVRYIGNNKTAQWFPAFHSLLAAEVA